MENNAITKNTGLCRAQSTVEGKSFETTTTTLRLDASVELNKGDVASSDATNTLPCNYSDIRATKLFEFSTKRPEDVKEVYITGILSLLNKFIIIDRDNRKLKLYSENGEYLSSTNLIEDTYGITQVEGVQFATCGLGLQIFLWNMEGNTIIPDEKRFKLDHDAYGIHFNGTFYCVLHRLDNAVTILDVRGATVRKFLIKEVFGKEVQFGLDIHSDSNNHHVYIPCVGGNNGIICVSVEGEVLRFTELDDNPWGISEIHGFLCVVDIDNACVHFMSPDWKSRSKLLVDNVLQEGPMYIAVNDVAGKFVISYYKKDVITVFTQK